MARISLILILLLWLSWTAPEGQALAVRSAHEYVTIFGSMGVVLLGMGLYSRLMVRRVGAVTFHRDMHYFNKLSRICRLAIPAWFGVAVFAMDWPAVVRQLVPTPVTLDSLLLLIGTLPAVLALILLWWATYPTERVVRDMGIVDRMLDGAPVRMGPTLWQHLLTTIRTQLLFMLVPVVVILGLRDVVGIALHAAKVEITQSVEIIASLACMLPMIVLLPVLLVRVLPTERLPDSPLRQRLEELCRRHGVRVKDVLLWKTHSSLGNAAVMGVVPGLRYLLVTDLLLEAMPEEQVVAVFAHEIGHVVHRHLLWMAACVLCLLFTTAGPVELVLYGVEKFITLEHPYDALVGLALTAPLLFCGFGYVVRRFERQADVFAARSLAELPLGDGQRSFVTSQGASVMCSALHGIASLNNIPVKAGEWLHGSIGWRMNFLSQISDDPHRTWKFDRQMRWMATAIIAVTIVMALWTVWNVIYLDQATPIAL